MGNLKCENCINEVCEDRECEFCDEIIGTGFCPTCNEELKNDDRL